MNIRFILLIIVLLAVVSFAKKTSKSTTRSNSKNNRNGNRKSDIVKTSSRRNKYDDDEDDDEDDDYRSSRKTSSSSKKRSSKSSSGGRKGMKHPSKMRASRSSGSRGSRNSRGRSGGSQSQLIPWAQKIAATAGPSIMERMEELQKQSTAAYQTAYRRAKVLRSSAFEGMLLKATWPDNNPVPQQLLDEIIKYSIPAFKYGRSADDDDPYHMTIHKLYMKMTEKDWRTVTKSLYILHSISKECAPDVCDRFSMAIKDMSKTREIKTDTRYFDKRAIIDLNEESEDYEEFVAVYSDYVLNRAKFSASKFDELKSLTSGETSEKVAVARLKRAHKTLTLGLKVAVENRKNRNLFIAQCIRLICHDIRDIYKLLGVKLEPLCGVGAIPTSDGGDEESEADCNRYIEPSASEKDVSMLLNSYLDLESKVKDYLGKSAKAYEVFRVKMPAEKTVKSSASLEDGIRRKLAALTSGVDSEVGGVRDITDLRGGARDYDSDEDSDEEEDEDSDEEEDEDSDEEEDEDSDEEEDEDSDEEEDEEDEEEDEDSEDEEEDEDSDEDSDEEEDEDSDEEEDEDSDEEEDEDSEDEEEDEDSDGEDDEDDDDDDEESDNDEDSDEDEDEDSDDENDDSDDDY